MEAMGDMLLRSGTLLNVKRFCSCIYVLFTSNAHMSAIVAMHACRSQSQPLNFTVTMKIFKLAAMTYFLQLWTIVSVTLGV